MEEIKGSIRPYHREVVILFRTFDCLLIVLIYYLLTLFHDRPWVEREMLIATWAIAVFLVASEFFNLYRRWRASHILEELSVVWLTWLLVIIGVLALVFMSKSSERYSRFVMGGWFVLTPVTLSVWKAGFRIFLRKLRKKGYNTRSVAIIGANKIGFELMNTIEKNPWLGMRLKGVYDDRSPVRFTELEDKKIEIEGNFNQILEQAKAGELDLIYIALPFKAEDRIQELIRKFADTTASVYVVADLLLSDLMHSTWTHVGDLQVMSVYESRIHGIDGLMKRIFDLVLMAFILPMTIIPMGIIAILVKLSSKGPVLFCQDRYGLNGQKIRVMKFRSMTVAENTEITQATKGDKRVTKLGAILRRTSLDELPQLFNILKGDMSFVGPRPHAVQHNEIYRKKIHGYMLRYKVKPGLTGWAQVNGWRGETETLDKMEKRVEYDLFYIQHWSYSFDLKIVLMTIKEVFVGRNAY